jgi:hypothetical protein
MKIPILAAVLAAGLGASAAPAPAPTPRPQSREVPCEVMNLFYDEIGRRNARPLPPPRNWLERRARRKLEGVI